MDLPIPEMDPLEMSMIDTLAHQLKDLDGNDVIPMTLDQFGSIYKTIKFNSLTIEFEVVEIEEVLKDGGLCHIYFVGGGSKVMTGDTQIEVHTQATLMVYIRLGELVTRSGIFNTVFPSTSLFRNWPNTVAGIKAQTTISNGSLGDGDYTLIPMSLSEFLVLEENMSDVYGLVIRGSSINTGRGIHGFSLSPDPDSEHNWTAWYPSGQISQITPEHIVKVVTHYPAPIIEMLSKLRKGE